MKIFVGVHNPQFADKQTSFEPNLLRNKTLLSFICNAMLTGTIDT